MVQPDHLVKEFQDSHVAKGNVEVPAYCTSRYEAEKTGLVYTCVCTHAFVHVCTSAQTQLCTRACVHMRSCRARVYTCINMCTHACVHMHVHIHVHTHACTSTCIHVHMHVHIHVYMHTCTHACTRRESVCELIVQGNFRELLWTLYATHVREHRNG